LSRSSLIFTTLSDLTTHRFCYILCSLVAFYFQSCIIRPNFVLSTKNYVFLITLSTTYAKYLFPQIISRNRLAISIKTRARITSFYKNKTLLIWLQSFISLQTLYISLFISTIISLLSIVTLYKFLNLSSRRYTNLLYISLYFVRFSVRDSFLKLYFLLSCICILSPLLVVSTW